VPLEIYNFQDIASCARRFADQLEAGEQGEAERVVSLVQMDGDMTLHVWGENAAPLEVIGLLEAAKMKVYASLLCGDDD